MISYLRTVRDKVRENQTVMHQLANNAPEQALLGDFPAAVDDAVMASGEAHQNQMTQYLNSKQLQAGFQRVVFDMLLRAQAKGPGRTAATPPSDADHVPQRRARLELPVAAVADFLQHRLAGRVAGGGTLLVVLAVLAVLAVLRRRRHGQLRRRVRRGFVLRHQHRAFLEEGLVMPFAAQIELFTKVLIQVRDQLESLTSGRLQPQLPVDRARGARARVGQHEAARVRPSSRRHGVTEAASEPPAAFFRLRSLDSLAF